MQPIVAKDWTSPCKSGGRAMNVMKKGLLRWQSRAVTCGADQGGPEYHVACGLGFELQTAGFRSALEDGSRIERDAVAPDADGLFGLVGRVGVYREPVRAAIESMNGVRASCTTSSSAGAGESRSRTRRRSRGLAPLACKTGKIDAWVLAELSRRELVPAIWLPSFEQRSERERARWRLFLVRKRSALKHEEAIES
jgi:hypothetical protein